MREKRKTPAKLRTEMRKIEKKWAKIESTIRKKRVDIKQVNDDSGVIYKATNTFLENNNVYIGKTYNFQKRKKQHLRDAANAGGFKFHEAIRLYGAQNFKWEIIDYFNDIKESDAKERDWIARYNSVEFGYNSA